MTPEERFQRIEETLLAAAEERRIADRRWEEQSRRWEKRFAKFDESVLVTAEMQRNSDRRWEERFGHLGEKVAEHDLRLTRVEEVVASLAAAEKKLYLALDKLAGAHRGTDAILEALSEKLEAVSEKLDALADGQKVTRAMLDALIKNIDRFVRGQGGNGRGGQGGRRKG